MKTHQMMWRGGRAALLVATAGLTTSALAADLDPTGQAGEYKAQVPVVQVKGAAIPGFADSTVFAPFILLGSDALVNGTQVENVNGRAVGYVTSFDADPMAVGVNRTVTVLGTTDADDGGVSNNVIVREMDNRSNSPGEILPDGTLVWLARFSGNQNNIDVEAGITGVLPQTLPAGGEPIQSSIKGLSPNAVAIGNATETGLNPSTATVLGAVFLGTPGAMREPGGGALLLGHTSFNTFPALTAAQFAASVNGVNVYRGINADPRSGDPGNSAGFPNGPDHAAGWTQGSVPLPINPPGESSNDARQTQPAIQTVTTPSGDEVVYVIHGVGFSGGTPFTGSSFSPMYLAVDTLRTDYAAGNPVAEDNTIIIEADPIGGVGTQHGAPAGSGAGFADLDNTDPNQRFIDHGATGGSAEVSTGGQFDMNANGYVAAVHQDRSGQPTVYSIRLYSPIWNAAENRIVGYNLESIVTGNGDVDTNNNTLIPAQVIDTTPSPAFEEITLNPFSGVSLDNNNRVAFSAITEAFQLTGDFDNNPFTPDTTYLLGQNTSLFVYDLDTDSLHKIIDGGQNGTELADGFPANGADEILQVGTFAFDGDTDTFNRAGYSRDGSYLGISFRSSPNVFMGGLETEFDTLPDGTPENFTDRGGLLYQPGQMGNNERTARGSLIIELGEFDSGAVACCLGNGAKESPGQVNFADITAVLGNWLNNYGAGNTGPGDSNCDGLVNFADVTTTLGTWLNVCP